MGKTVDVDLRIRAKNLTKATVGEITADVDRLTQAQKAQAKASDLAARSMKELVAEQNFLAAASRELARRSNLAEQFSRERAEIEKTSAKIKELANLRRQAATPAGRFIVDQSVGQLDKEIAQAEKSLKKLTTTNERTGSTLRALGVDTNNVEVETRQLAEATAKSASAYSGAVDDVTRYGAAVERNNAILAEAARRTKEEAAARQAAVGRTRAAVATTGGQAGQLAALRADIEARSALARAADISSEAQRRAGQEAQETAARQRAATDAIRASVSAYDARIQRERDLQEVFGKQLPAQERLSAAEARAAERKTRLVALLNSERGQRILTAEATRRHAAEVDKDTAATSRNATATGRAAKEQQLFADTGRKSLSVYQRIRGQVLGLAAAYVGVFQVIGTFRNALDAVNRNQALTIGLKTVNNGDAKAAAADYKFLREEADRLGLVFDDIAPKFAGMAIAGKAVGLTGTQIRDAFTNVAESVAAGNLSLEDSDGVFRAVVQVMSKARVQAEELRGQLGDRLPGAVAAFAKANNIALTDLDEHLKKGRGNIDQFLKFLQAYSSQYAPTLDEATQRLQANINRARNAYNDWLRQLLSSSNQTALKGAFKAIEDFFKGQDGQRFAESLGKAFRLVVDIFMLLANNVDLVIKLFKAFLAIQALKFAIDVANGMRNLAVQIAAVGNASAAASAKTTAFAGGLGKIKAAGLGVAAVLLGITAAIDGQTSKLERANARMTDYINTLDKLGTRQGIAKAASFDESVANVKNAQEIIKANKERLAQLNELEKKGLSLTQGIGAIFGTNDLPITTKGLDEERVRLTRQTLELEREITNEREFVQPRLLAAQLKADEDAAKAAKPTAVVSEEKKEKKPKGPDLEQLARNRADAERAVADKIIEIQDDIAQAKIDSEAKTEAQIETNYNATLERIKLKIAETRNDIAKLQQNSEKAGVDSSAGFTQADGLLINLEAQLQKKAEYDRLTAIIELREKRINDLIAARDAKLQLINAQVQLGTMSQVEGYVQANLAQDEFNGKIQTEIAAFQTLVSTIQQGGPLWVALGLDETVAKFAQVNVEATKLTNMQLFKKNFFPQIAQGAANALVVLGQGLAQAAQGAGSVEDAFKAAGEAFLTFAADFLTQIAMMIAQQAILNALQGGGNSWQSIIGSALGGSTGHTGGTVKSSGKIGSGNAVRKISPMTFAANYAGRFHEGRMPGLRNNEVTAILKKREEVLTENDPRNVLNGGLSQGPTPVTIVNSIDSAEVVKQGWQGGQGVILNDVKANKGKWRAALGIPN